MMGKMTIDEWRMTNDPERGVHAASTQRLQGALDSIWARRRPEQ
jgi:hypothetical protein